jgi:ribonuclease D
MQQRRQEVVIPKEAWRYRQRLAAAYASAGCLQLLADWRCVKRASAIWPLTLWFGKSIWAVARYMPGSLGELDSIGLSGSEIRFHGKTLLALVAKRRLLEALPEPLQNLMDMPGYRKALKILKRWCRSELRKAS